MSLTQAEIQAEFQSRFQLNPNPWTMFFRGIGREITITVYPPKDFYPTVDQLNLLGTYLLEGNVKK